MGSKSKVSGHWTDQQMIAHLYGVGPEDEHLRECVDCDAKVSSMKKARAAVEFLQTPEPDVSFEFLAAQRRRIYARLPELNRWLNQWNVRRWISATAMILILGGSAAVYEQQQHRQVVDNSVSDAQLAEQVATMAQDAEPSPTAPLHALFE